MRIRLNKKKQELRENTIKIDDLMTQNKSLKEGLDDSKKVNESEIKENNKLRDEIEKLKKAKVKRSNIIDDLVPKLL